MVGPTFVGWGTPMLVLGVLCYTPVEFEAPRSEPTIVKDAVERGVGYGRRTCILP
jgi:hypothetical protein